MSIEYAVQSSLVIQEWIALLQLWFQVKMFQLKVGFEPITLMVATSNSTTELRPFLPFVIHNSCPAVTYPCARKYIYVSIKK